MRISGTEPSSVILSQRKKLKKFKILNILKFYISIAFMWIKQMLIY